MLAKKKLLLFSFAFIYSLSVHANQNEETPTILLFFGRFHPLLLHLPIGALLLTLFIEIIGKFRKHDFSIMIVNALAFTAFFSVLTAILGYFLSLEGGYGEEVLQVHMIAGIAMALLTCMLFIAKKKQDGSIKKMYVPLYVITLLLTIVTGHYGSILTHGDTFLTAYSPINFEEEEIIMETDSLYYFKHVITPILEDKCIQCHNPNKTKGELNLSTVEHIRKGGENGEVVIAGNIDDSPLYGSLIFPIEDDLHMPPSGKPQLTRDEIWLIKNWISTGADFKKQITTYRKNDTLSNLLYNYLLLPKKKVKEANPDDLKTIMNHGFSIKKIVFGEPYLSATYGGNEKITKKAMQSLTKISDQLIDLNLQESKLTDDLTDPIKKLQSLKNLRLDRTFVTDKSLKVLKGNEELVMLNLFNTNVTDEGLEELLKSIKPQKVFFGTEGNQSKEIVIHKNEAETKVTQGLIDGFIEKTKLEKPIIISGKSIFESEIKIEVKGSLKNEKIYYTMDGTDPDSTSQVYSEPIILKKSSLFKTRSYKKNWYGSDIVARDYNKIKYKVEEVSVKYQPEESYTGIQKLIDLEKGTTNFRDGHWNGYHKDLIATLDMGQSVEFDALVVNCLKSISSYIFYPMEIVVYVGNDLNALNRIEKLDIPLSDRSREIEIKSFKLDLKATQNARYIKVYIKNMKKNPQWHEAPGAQAWLFVDEIMIL